MSVISRKTWCKYSKCNGLVERIEVKYGCLPCIQYLCKKCGGETILVIDRGLSVEKQKAWRPNNGKVD